MRMTGWLDCHTPFSSRMDGLPRASGPSPVECGACWQRTSHHLRTCMVPHTRRLCCWTWADIVGHRGLQFEVELFSGNRNRFGDCRSERAVGIGPSSGNVSGKKGGTEDAGARQAIVRQFKAERC